MRPHADARVQIARRPAVQARTALARNPQAAAVGHARRNPHRHRLLAQAAVRLGPREGQALLGAARGVHEIELELGLDVGAPPAHAPAPPALAREQVREQVVEPFVGEALRIAEAARPLAAAPEARPEGLARAPRSLGIEAALERDLAELVVRAPLLRVREHGVGVRDLLELVLGALVVRVDVRVMAPRELAVRLADHVLARVARDAEDLVEILLRALGH